MLMGTSATHIGNACHGCACKHTCTDTHTCARTHTHHYKTHVKYRSVQPRIHCLFTHRYSNRVSMVYITTNYSPPLDSFSTLRPICHEKRANMAHTTNRTILNMTRGDIPPRLEQGGDCRGRGRFSSTFVSLGPCALSSSSALTVEEGFM